LLSIAFAVMRLFVRKGLPTAVDKETANNWEKMCNTSLSFAVVNK
jgi:hypothetical protein